MLCTAVTNIGLILVNRSHSAPIVAAPRHSNAALWRVLAVAAALLALIAAWPPSRALFHIGPVHDDDLAVCFGAGAAVLVDYGVIRDRPAGSSQLSD
jgi:Ca2+-transporting ATPase